MMRQRKECPVPPDSPSVENETAGSLLADGSALKTALASAGQDSPIKVMITGEISDQDLANLKEQMIGGSNGNKYFKVSHLYITASGATTIPEGFCKTGDNTNTALQEVILPEGITSIGERAFQSCTTLKSIQLPKKVTKIGKYAFINCRQLTNIQLPDGVTEIGEYAFVDCSSLTEISIPTGVTKIGERTFQSCANLTSIQLPETVTEIGQSAFNYCGSLKEINIPKAATSIGSYAFQYCSSLTEISIPKAVTSIGVCAFYDCSALEEVVLSGTNDQFGFFLPTVGDGAFAGTSATLLFLTDVTEEMFKAEGNAATCQSWGSVTWKAIHYNLTADNPASLTDTANYSGHWLKDSPQ